MTPQCNKGAFEGHAKVASLADLERLEGYTAVTGMLEVSGADDLVCLDGLACLKAVGQDVRIQDNAALRSTAGLRSLRTVGTAWARPQIFIGGNRSLEVFQGFSLEGSVNHLVVWDNASLTDVTGLQFEQLSTLTLLNNPQLVALTSLHGVSGSAVSGPRCFVNHNPLLCTEEIRSVCTELDEYAQLYHGVDCPEGPAGRIEHAHDELCSIQTEDCPAGEKCMPQRSTRLECRPIAPEPRAVGQSCTSQEPTDGHDDWELHAICRGGACWSMAFGDESSLACPDPNEQPTTDADGVELFCVPSCDPLEGDCGDGQVCVALRYGFVCGATRPDPPVGFGESCEWINACASGMGCVAAEASNLCEQGADACCVPFCDIESPDCPSGSVCRPWWEEDEQPVPKVEHVGVCVGQ